MTVDVARLLSGEVPSGDQGQWREPHLILSGVPTDSVLGLLCAAGTLRVLDAAWPSHDVRLAWRRVSGTWRPCLWASPGKLDGSETEKRQSVVDALWNHLSPADAPWLTLADDLRMPLEDFQRGIQVMGVPDTTHRKALADWLPAFGCELPGEHHAKKGMLVSETDLNTMNGAGHQHFVESMRELASQCEQHHLMSALFSPWNYSDPQPYLRFDPRDNRDPAYRAFDPLDTKTKNAMSPITTVRGANRLASEAFPLFPTAPQRTWLATTGFAYLRDKVSRREVVALRFPLWADPISCTSLKWLLRHPELTADEPDPGVLKIMGVQTVLRAVRNQTDKGSRSFLPAAPLG